MAYEYDVHSPSSGPAAWLPQELMINGSPNNWRLRQARIDPNFRPNQVLRWDKTEAALAERILRREYARLGLIPDESMVQGLIATMALDQCGAFNARLPDDPWNWQAFACFCQWFARLDPQYQMEFLVDVAGNSCGRWMPVVIQVLAIGCQDTATDPWLRGHNVWKIQEGAYVFDAAPPGTDVQVSPPGTLPAPPNPVVLPETPAPPGPAYPQAIPGSVVQNVCERYPGGYSCQWIDYCRATSAVGAGCAWYCDLDPTALGCPVGGRASSSAQLVTAAAASPEPAEKPKASAGAWIAGTLIALAGVGLFAAALTQPARNPDEHPAFTLLKNALRAHTLPSTKGERQATADEFMLMQSDRNVYWFKHRHTRNYLGIQRWTGDLIIPATGEPFNKGLYDLTFTPNPRRREPETMSDWIAQELVHDPFMKPKALDKWYTGQIKHAAGRGAQVKAVRFEYTRPAAADWDYGHYAIYEVTSPGHEIRRISIHVNVSEKSGDQEASGNVSAEGVGIVAVRRGKTPEKVLVGLMSEAAPYIRA